MPSLLLKKEYIKLLKNDTDLSEELNQFFKEYIKTAQLYKDLNQKMPEKNFKEKKLKI